MKILTTIVWDYKGRAEKHGEGQLDIRIRFNGKYYHIGTGIKVRKAEYVAGKIVNRPDASVLNDRLAILYSKVCACVDACVRDGEEFNIEAIKTNIWSVKETNSKESPFIDWCEEQIPLLGVSDGTVNHYNPLIVRLTEYGRIKTWDDLTVENICNFDAWLHTVTKPLSDAKRKAGAQPEKLSDGGIYNYHKCLRALLNRALTFGKIENNPYNRLKGKIKRGDKPLPDYLSEDEMNIFETLILPKGSTIDVARDLFVFQMYTGLSYSDMQAFDASDYKWDGTAWKNVGERIKTGVPYVSYLLPPAVKVLEKYNWEIPQISNADYNRQLKALQTMTGIKTKLHSHLARHTFATFMLDKGVPIEHVSKMLGHTNITQTQRYAKVKPKAIYDDFDRVAAMMTKATEPTNKRKKKQ
jgi:integrase